MSNFFLLKQKLIQFFFGKDITPTVNLNYNCILQVSQIVYTPTMDIAVLSFHMSREIYLLSPILALHVQIFLHEGATIATLFMLALMKGNRSQGS